MQLDKKHIIVAILTAIGMGDIPLRPIFPKNRLVNIIKIRRFRERYFDEVLFGSFCSLRSFAMVWVV